MASGQAHVLPMDGDTLLLGSGAAAHVMLQVPDLEPLHLRFVRTDAGVRVEPVRAGGIVVVNGEELFCKDLQNGDVIEVAAMQLRWLADRTPSVPRAPVEVLARTAEPRPSRPAVRAAAKTAAPVRESAREPVRESSRSRRSRGNPGWLPMVAVIGLVVVGGAVALRVMSGSTWPRGPQHYVDLAREQVANAQLQRAKDTLDFALRDATGTVRAEALALQASVRRLQDEVDSGPRIQVARKDHDTIVAFAGRYLRESVTRPAARELVRLCDRWLAMHRELCKDHSDGQPLLRTVEQHLAQYQALAATSEPDSAADVMFAAQSMLRFQWRDYRGAIPRLDGFLQQHPDDAEVGAMRERLLQEGEAWLLGRLQLVDHDIRRGDHERAAAELRQLEQWSVLPQWASLVQERRQRLEAR